LLYIENEHSRATLQRCASTYSEPLFIVFPRDGGTSWSLATVINDSAFSNRKSLPESWRGKVDDELEKITGVIGATFCHKAGFLVVADTRVAIEKLAEKALLE
jgi:uncharacterized UPF0160 family protein